MHLTAISAFIRPKVDILNNCHRWPPVGQKQGRRSAGGRRRAVMAMFGIACSHASGAAGQSQQTILEVRFRVRVQGPGIR